MVMFPTRIDAFKSIVIECGKGAPPGLESVCQKVLGSPSIAFEHSLPVCSLSQVTVHGARSIASEVTSAAEGRAGIMDSGMPSKNPTRLKV